MCIVRRGILALHPDWPTETLGGKQLDQSPCSRQVLTLVPCRSLPSSELGCGGCEAVEMSANLLCAWEQSGQHLSKAALSSE